MRWLISVFALLFLAGCSYSEPVIEEVSTLCTPPYFEYKTGECCLDDNSNQLCDVDEIQKFPPEEKESLVVEVPDSCDLGTYFECSNIVIKDDAVLGGYISFDLTFKKFGSAVVTKIDFPELGCSKTFSQWSIDDGVRQVSKPFSVECKFKGDALANRFADSQMVLDVVHYDEVRQGIDSAWAGTYDVKKITVVGQVSGSI